jgi:hypothetical protein
VRIPRHAVAGASDAAAVRPRLSFRTAAGRFARRVGLASSREHATWGLGCMRDDAKLIDEIGADAYRHRQEDTWREIDS